MIIRLIIWKPIVGYEGYYEVNNNGEVRSLKREITLPNGNKRTIPARILKPKKNGIGYLFYTLSKGGIPKTVYVHRAVADAFLINPENKLEVNHCNGIKTDNTVENLEWVTHAENVRHCYDTGLCNNKGGNHFRAISIIDNFLGKVFDTIKEWCDARGINYATGRNILGGRQKSKKIDLSAIFKQEKKKKNG